VQTAKNEKNINRFKIFQFLSVAFRGKVRGLDAITAHLQEFPDIHSNRTSHNIKMTLK